MRPVIAFIGLGSNLAHPRRQLARAAGALRRLAATRLIAVSPNYVTAPIGADEPQPDYVNAVVAVATRLAPHALLGQLQAIERRQRRVRDPRGPRNQPRTLDADLLLYGGRAMRRPRLVLPHPRMHVRAFVLRPLVDIAPHTRIPGRGLARTLLRAVAGQRIERTRGHRVR